MHGAASSPVITLNHLRARSNLSKMGRKTGKQGGARLVEECALVQIGKGIELVD
jgi:hypothetical protein